MLTNRQLLILQLTVEDFIESAQPVGSRQLSKKPEAPFSPATIRNDMADLEEMGLFRKNSYIFWKSAFRKRISVLCGPFIAEDKLNLEDSHCNSFCVSRESEETEELIRKSATILSDLTNYTSILLGPDSSMHAVKTIFYCSTRSRNCSRDYCDG